MNITQKIDLSGAVGKVVAGVLFELADIRERRPVGIVVAKEKGVYRCRKRGSLKANLVRVRELKAGSMKQDEIMKALGSKSSTTLNNYLKTSPES